VKPPSSPSAAAHADNMALTRNALPNRELRDVRAHLGDLACIFMADDHRDRDGPLRPLIPSVDVDIRTADPGLVDLDENVIRSDLRNPPFVKPEPGFGGCFDKSFHESTFVNIKSRQALCRRR
jgi:hypothetical protein